jgi:hypothetical protein
MLSPVIDTSDKVLLLAIAKVVHKEKKEWVPLQDVVQEMKRLQQGIGDDVYAIPDQPHETGQIPYEMREDLKMLEGVVLVETNMSNPHVRLVGFGKVFAESLLRSETT